MDFVQSYGAILNTVITLVPVLTYNLKRTVESNTNDLNKKYYYYFVTKCVISMYLLIPLIFLKRSAVVNFHNQYEVKHKIRHMRVDCSI